MTRVICRTMRRLDCKLFITSVTCRLSPNQWIILLTMLIFLNAYCNASYRCDYSWHTATTLVTGLLLARDTGRMPSKVTVVQMHTLPVYHCIASSQLRRPHSLCTQVVLDLLRSTASCGMCIQSSGKRTRTSERGCKDNKYCFTPEILSNWYRRL